MLLRLPVSGGGRRRSWRAGRESRCNRKRLRGWQDAGGGNTGGGKNGEGKGARICKFFITGTCKKGDACDYTHDKGKRKAYLDKKKTERANSAPGERTAASSNKDLAEKIKKLEAEKKELARRTSAPAFCKAYITNGCFDPDCALLHVEQEQIDRSKAAKKALAAAKAKAKKAAKRSRSAG